MDVLLIPGLWLDADTWSEVTPALDAAGHTPHPLTLPGIGEPASTSSEIGIADWVSAVVAEIDALDGPVALVGHSGGGNVAWGAADARPDRVAAVVFVDTFPPGDGGTIWEFPIVDGVIPFPGWDTFEENEIADLDDDVREQRAAAASSVPARVPTDPITLRDERRLALPVTMITGTVAAAEIREIIAKGPEWAREMAAIERLDIVDFASGHWPQFSRPADLGQAIADAIA